MSESDFARAVGRVAALLGIVTGLGTVIGWVATEDFRSAAEAILPIAAYAYLAIVIVGTAGVTILYFRIPDRAELSINRRIAGALSYVFCAAAVMAVVLGYFWRPILIGFAAFAVIISLTVSWWLHGWRRYETAQLGPKKCPDCAELIKLEARVCRYCGFRFAPRPPVPRDGYAYPDTSEEERISGTSHP